MASLFVRATRIFCTFPDFTGNARSNLCVDEYLTADEAAAYIRVHVETLRKWLRLGVFPHIPLPVVNNGFESGVSRDSARFFSVYPLVGIVFFTQPASG